MSNQGTGVEAPRGGGRRFWVWFFLAGFLVVVGGILLVLLGLAAMMKGQVPQVKPDSTLVISMERPLQEQPPDPIVTELFKAKIYTVYDLEVSLKKAAKDDRIKSVLLEVGLTPMGFGKMEEVRAAILDFKKSKKPVWATFEMTGNGGYYLASTADKVVAPPCADIMLTGLLAEVPFYRGILDNVKVEPQLYHIGDYKSYSDIFTRKEMSDAHRESMDAILDSLYGQMVKGIAQGRKMDEAAVRAAVDQGMLWGPELKAKGLVDELLYQDQMEEGLKKINGNKDKWIKVDLADYAKDSRVDPSEGAKSHLGLILASGGIVSGPEGGSAGSDNMVSGQVVKWLRKVGEDKDVKAVVLRVDSPGGSGLASDVIWRQVQVLRKSKPVVVSMSDVAASGGYYIAMGSDGIVAQPGTITGSIGVVTGKFVLKGLYEWMGMNHEVMKRGANADLFSATVRFSPEQETLVHAQMEAFYKDFVTKVADGRKKSYEEVHAMAQGRVWTGEQALGNGLVDRLGGIPEAIELAKEKAKIPKGEAVRVNVWPKPRSIIEAFLNTSQDEMARARLLSSMPPELAEMYRAYDRVKPLCADPLAAYCPVEVKVQ
jgi:protease-4